MTGIERLRELAHAVTGSVWANTSSGYCEKYGLSINETGGSLTDALADIADQIEAEQDERVTRRVEDRDAIEWVREHGGLDAVEKRLMPEGMEWPKYTDGEMVRIGDDYECWCGETNTVCSVTIRDGRSVLNESQSHSFVVSDGQFTAHGKCVKRPAPKVLDAGGVEIRVGDTVWLTDGRGPWSVTRIVYADRLRVICDDEENGHLNVYPQNITHRAPVLAADGKPLKEGDKVWSTAGEFDGERTVKNVCKDPDEPSYAMFEERGEPWSCLCCLLTHERPDSWERIEEDAGKNPFDYCKDVGHRLDTCENAEWYKARDLVRRARALAERERGE